MIMFQVHEMNFKKMIKDFLLNGPIKSLKKVMSVILWFFGDIYSALI